MAASFELVPCVPVGPQAGALGQMQAEEWVYNPQDLRAMTVLFLGQGSVVQHQVCGLLLCCYFRIPVSVTHSHTEQVGRGLHGCGHLATRLSLLWP